MRRALVLVLLAAACFPRNPPSGTLRCSADPKRPCPSGYYCAGDDKCWAKGSGPTLADLSVTDQSTPPDLGEDDAAECSCFQHGTWHLDRVIPCLAMSGGSYLAISSVTGTDGRTVCPLDTTRAPGEAWSASTLMTDCPGHYRLCYALKAGDSDIPQPGDCTVVEACVEVDYATGTMTQATPPLPGWLAGSTACVQSFAASGGYGEMRVEGTPNGCRSFSRVFHRIRYCAVTCSGVDGGACLRCLEGSDGAF